MMICSGLVDRAVDHYLYPEIHEPGAGCAYIKYATYDVGGTQCLLVTREDAVCWIVYCHGNAVTLYDLFESGVPREISERCKCNFVAPAYAQKKLVGPAHDAAVVCAARAVYERICDDHGEPVYMAGRSLGVGIALQACLDRPPAGLLLLSGFSSVRAMTEWSWIRCLMGDRYNNAETIGSASLGDVHKIIIHGSNDELVPSEHAMVLEQSSSNSSLYMIDGMGHNPDTCWPQVYTLFARFMNKHLTLCTKDKVYPLWRT